MKHSASRTALLYAIFTGLWILGLDLLSDSLATRRPHFVQLHTAIAMFTVLFLYLLLSRELRARERMEHALRQTHDELELRVQERTKELGVANQELRAEIAKRVRVEEGRGLPWRRRVGARRRSWRCWRERALSWPIATSRIRHAPLFDACKNLLGAMAGYVALLTEEGTKNEAIFLDPGGADQLQLPGQ